jgi:hypothetical protein
MVDAAGVDRELEAAPRDQYNAIVLKLSDGTSDRSAAQRIVASGLDLYYWIEIARDVATAEAHPLWMASLQGHPEWRRLFPQAPKPGPNEVIKAFPWVPILYREAFDEHLRRVRPLLAGLPAPRGVFLNDLQGAPSACGCGNTLCRWTADYGPIRTATDAGPAAAAEFVRAVAGLVPDAEVIPVWVTECEEHDRDGACAGVGCFRGLCWKEYVKQFTPLAEQVRRVGVLLPVREFERELPVYREPAGWVTHALSTFRTLVPQHGGKAVEPGRLIAVVQGWDVTDAEVTAQTDRAWAAQAGGVVLSRVKIEQQWQPRVVRYQ